MSEDKPLFLGAPENLKENIPFFAYGIFKPGQLAFSKIEDYVEEIYYCKINYLMKIRDGVPIIDKNENKGSETYGYLIKFKKENEYDAYRTIGETEPELLYYWDEITVEDRPCYILKGNKFNSGSNLPEFDMTEFKGHKDPFFRETFDLIDTCLKINPKFSPDNEFKEFICYFFNLQMHYMLLWSAIDRFTSLKYNKSSKTKNIIEFSKQKSFEDSFKKNFTEDREIFTTDELKPFALYSDESWWDLGKTMNYYYKVRCNVVHRGKSITNDENDLKLSLIELSNIFKDVLNDTFNIVNIGGIDFCIPYGLKEVSCENDSIRIFKRNNDNPIRGIPDYTIEISSDLNDARNLYSINDAYFNIDIFDVEEDKIDDIIRHLNDKLKKVM